MTTERNELILQLLQEKMADKKQENQEGKKPLRYFEGTNLKKNLQI
jgi:hypothetical protein